MLDKIMTVTLIGATTGSGLALVLALFYSLMPGANLWASFLVFVMSMIVLIACFGAYFIQRDMNDKAAPRRT